MGRTVVGAHSANNESARLSSGATSLEAMVATVVQGANRAHRTSEMSERALDPCARQPDLSCEKRKDRRSTHLAGGRDQLQRNWLNLFAANNQHNMVMLCADGSSQAPTHHSARGDPFGGGKGSLLQRPALEPSPYQVQTKFGSIYHM